MIEWTEHEFVEEGAQCAKENGGEVHGQKVVDGWMDERARGAFHPPNLGCVRKEKKRATRAVSTSCFLTLIRKGIFNKMNVGTHSRIALGEMIITGDG